MKRKNFATGLVAIFFAFMVAVSCNKPSNSDAAGTNDTIPPPSAEGEYQQDQTTPQPDTVKDPAKDTVNRN